MKIRVERNEIKERKTIEEINEPKSRVLRSLELVNLYSDWSRKKREEICKLSMSGMNDKKHLAKSVIHSGLKKTLIQLDRERNIFNLKKGVYK